MRWLLLFLPILSGCADAILLYPSNERLPSDGAQQQFIQHGERRIETFVARSPGAAISEPRAYILEFCGNATRAEQTAAADARLWDSLPVEICTMNYPGFGQSDGPPALKTIPGDALAAYDHLAQTASGRPIFLRGFSLGTTVALNVASQRPCAGLILQSPPPLQREIMEHFGWWNLWLLAGPVALQVPGELNSLNTAPKVYAPAFFILTGKDQVVPIDYQKLVVRAFAGPKRVMIRPNADHNDRLEVSEIPEVDRGLQWIWQQAKLTE